MYELRPNIKSVAKNIDTLIDYGYEIFKKGKYSCYLVSRDFDKSEVMFSVDAIFSSKSILPKQAKVLIKKIVKDCSRFEKTRYKHILG